MSADYPPHWEADVVLADGGTMHLRPIVAADAGALVALHDRLSAETRRFRFFAVHPALTPAEVEHFTTVDYDERVALVATLGRKLVAVGRFDRAPGTDVAEVAFLVDDVHQGRGVGSVLLEHLAAIAAERGIHRFEAEVLAENFHMVNVFKAAGYQATRSYEQDVVRLEFSIEQTAASLAVLQSREHRSEARSIERLLTPRSVAVVGAGADPAGLGHIVLTNLLRGGFEGPVYPINSEADHVASVRAYPNVHDVPDDIDVAIVAIPYSDVPDVITQCADKGVRGLVVMSEGDGEAGDSGARPQRELVATARANGMRVIGPNCLGIINTAPGVRLNASLVPALPGRGRAGFFSQSGALGMAILSQVGRRGIGLSSFVSAGNRADVSGNDLLQYWEDDPDTDVVLLYLESFGNSRKFVRLARRVGRTKPIVAVQSGGSVAARLRAVIPAGAVDALFVQAGVIRVDTLSQLFDVAALLTSQPLPAGRRVAVVGNSASLGALAADACAGAGLLVGALSAGTEAAVRATLGPAFAVSNPLVLPADTGAEALHRTLAAVLADPSVDSVVAVYAPLVPVAASVIDDVLSTVGTGVDKPVVSTVVSLDGQRGTGPARPPGSVPMYPSPEDAVAALARTTVYAQWRRRPEGAVPALSDLQPDGARSLVDTALLASPAGVALDSQQVTGLLGAYGVPVRPNRSVTSLGEALAAAEQLGYPVALKATAEPLRHRPELGSVRLDIASATELTGAFEAITGRLGGAAELAVQAMVPPGIATVIRMIEDPSLGALVSFGIGGVATDLLGDHAFRVVPMFDVDAAELVRSVRAAPLLFGYRGSPPVDVAALEELLLRVARLADDVPELTELELNPVIAAAAGCSVLRASARLVRPTARLDAGPRRLV